MCSYHGIVRLDSIKGPAVDIMGKRARPGLVVGLVAAVARRCRVRGLSIKRYLYRPQAHHAIPRFNGRVPIEKGLH